MLTSCSSLKGHLRHISTDDERTLCGEIVWKIFDNLSWNCEDCTEELNEILEQLESVEFMKGKGWIKT